jgi:hypothetical protein
MNSALYFVELATTATATMATSQEIDPANFKTMRDINDYCERVGVPSLAQGMIELPPPQRLRQIASEVALTDNVHTVGLLLSFPSFLLTSFLIILLPSPFCHQCADQILFFSVIYFSVSNSLWREGVSRGHQCTFGKRILHYCNSRIHLSNSRSEWWNRRFFCMVEFQEQGEEILGLRLSFPSFLPSFPCFSNTFLSSSLLSFFFEPTSSLHISFVHFPLILSSLMSILSLSSVKNWTC